MSSKKCVDNPTSNDISCTNSGPSSSTSPIEKGKKRPSIPSSCLWNHFTKIEGCDVKEPLCKCNYYRKDYACEADSLCAHMNTESKEYPYRSEDKKQKVLSCVPEKAATEVESSSGSNEYVFSRKARRAAVTKITILDNLPFRFVEEEGFQHFCGEIPKFEIPTRITIAKDVLQLFLDEKKELKDLLSSNAQSVCLTTDTWSSLQDTKYACVTAHFIDEEWKLQRNILSFCQVSNKKGETIGKVLEACLLDWDIDKVLTITVDGSSNDEAINYIKEKLRTWNKCVLDGEFLEMTCCTYFVNLIVKDGLGYLHESIAKIRNVTRYVKSSSAMLHKFKASMQNESTECKGLPVLDMPNWWNSTYLMLEAAIRFRKAFEQLGEEDVNNKLASYLMDNESGEKRIGHPSSDDWNNVEDFVRVLKIFYDTLLKFNVSLCVTSNDYFLELCRIQSELTKLCQSRDSKLGSMACAMKRKYDNYWGLVDNNQLLFVSLVLDPGCKMDFVKYYFNERLDANLAAQMTRMVESTLMRLYKYYRAQNATQAPKQTAVGLHMQTVAGQGRPFLSNICEKWLEEKSARASKTELERYLSAPNESLEDDNIDVLEWWKIHSSSYPILSLIARDVLAIPVSTTASKSAFNIGDHVLDLFQSSLSPRILEALICAQNWLRSTPVSKDFQMFMNDLEKHEEIESELLGPYTFTDLLQAD